MPASTLPKFSVTTIHVTVAGAGESDLLQVECPRKTCQGVFYVARTWLQLDDNVVGRGCPWCHRWSEIPSDIRIAPPFKMEDPTNKARRVVRRSKSKRSK